jgi:hypothetical protein
MTVTENTPDNSQIVDVVATTPDLAILNGVAQVTSGNSIAVTPNGNQAVMLHIFNLPQQNTGSTTNGNNNQNNQNGNNNGNYNYNNNQNNQNGYYNNGGNYNNNGQQNQQQQNQWWMNYPQNNQQQNNQGNNNQGNCGWRPESARPRSIVLE